MLCKIKIFSVQIEVSENVFVVHEDGVFPGDWEVAVTHHLLAGVDDCGLHHTGLSILGVIGVVPQPTCRQGHENQRKGTGWSIK